MVKQFSRVIIITPVLKFYKSVAWGPLPQCSFLHALSTVFAVRLLRSGQRILCSDLAPPRRPHLRPSPTVDACQVAALNDFGWLVLACWGPGVPPRLSKHYSLERFSAF